jgi:hypothetical protein
MIWILASNALDPVIAEFKRAYEEENGEDEDYAVMGRQLQPLLTAALKAKFGVSNALIPIRHYTAHMGRLE